MKECYGDKEELKKLGEIKKYSYTIEQMLDNNLKCKNGENFLEVENRMNSSIEYIIKRNMGKKVAIVSHGAAIKYYLKKYCDFYNNKLIYEGNEVVISSPCILKLEFENLKLNKIIFL